MKKEARWNFLIGMVPRGTILVLFSRLQIRQLETMNIAVVQLQPGISITGITFQIIIVTMPEGGILLV